MPDTSSGSRARSATQRSDEPVAGALLALTADELRDFVRGLFDTLDEDTRAVASDLLVARAVRGSAGWRPPMPTSTLADDARSFIAGARRRGEADPGAVDRLLRDALHASLAGDHATARVVFELVLEAINEGDVYLGQHELLDEVLMVDLGECGRRLLLATYLTTPLEARADAVLSACERVEQSSYLADPIVAIEATLDGPAPELAAFLSPWIRCLRAYTNKSPWDTARDRWLRAAIARRDGAAGLAKLARTTKQADAARAWCQTLVADGVWEQALAAYEESAALVGADERGGFLDGAALAAQVLGRADVGDRLALAWRAAPSVARLARYLVSGDAPPPVIRERARAERAAGVAQQSLAALLDVVAGELARAAAIVSDASGLGWSHGGHPGHLIFEVFARLLGASLPEATPSLDVTDDSVQEQLATPSLDALLRRADVAHDLTIELREVVLDAMKAAAEHRIDALTRDGRRRHYGHAAALVATCAALDRQAGAPSRWAEAVQLRARRWPALRAELAAALRAR